MLEIDIKHHIFKYKQIWFADFPGDVQGCSRIVFNECKNMVDLPGFSRKEHTTKVIDLRMDLKTIWGNAFRKSCRTKINRARREGIVIKTNQNVDRFLEIEKAFRGKKGLGAGWLDHPEFIKYGTLFTAEFGHDLLAGQLYLEDRHNIRWLVGASPRLESDKETAFLISRANRLIIWEAIQYAKNKSIEEFDLGGYYTGDDPLDPRNSINYFKQDFGGQLTTHYIYQKEYAGILKLARLISQNIMS